MAKKEPGAASKSAATPKDAAKLVEMHTNRLVRLALRDVSEVLKSKIEAADEEIRKLKKQRGATKSFSSYRDINALRNLKGELSKLSGSLKTQLAALRKGQDALLSSAGGSARERS